MNQTKLYFQEDQKNDSWWFRLSLAVTWIVTVIPVSISAYQEFQKSSQQNEQLYVAFFTILFITGMMYFLSSFRLQTRIDTSGVHVRLYPKMRKWRFIPKEMIVKYEVKEFRPLREFGGWGAKKSWRRRSQSYTISGRTGIRLFLNDGKEVLIGTRQKQSALYAFRKLMENEQK